jgi:Bacterial shufflon protein, N-terminal constant region/Chaperone of endosialidase
MRDLIALIGAIIISVVLSVGLSRSSLVATRATSNARYAASYAAALNGSRTFFATNRTTILGQLAGTNANQFTIANLIAAGALDPSFQATTATGGTYCIDVRMLATTPATIQGRLTVVGETAPLSQIAASSVATEIAQASVGIVSGNAVIGPDVNQPLAAFTGPGACAPGQNSVAAIVSDGDILATGQFLSRVAIPGNPSANTMATALNMGGNAVTNAATITTTGAITDGGPLTVAGTETVTGAASAASYTASGTGTFGSLVAPSFDHTSDSGLKTPLSPLVDTWDMLRPLEIGAYRYLYTDRATIGFTAQSVLRTMPTLVHTDERGYFTVDYDGVFAVGLEELRRQHERLDELADRIDRLTRCSTPASAP